jgi:hypothetical protein
MAVLRRRNKLVSFRLSEQEYEALQSVSASEGARSISDFARAALCEVLVANRAGAGNHQRPADNTVNITLERLATTMGELNRVISRLSSRVENNGHNGNGHN